MSDEIKLKFLDHILADKDILLYADHLHNYYLDRCCPKPDKLIKLYIAILFDASEGYIDKYWKYNFPFRVNSMFYNCPLLYTGDGKHSALYYRSLMFEIDGLGKIFDPERGHIQYIDYMGGTKTGEEWNIEDIFRLYENCWREKEAEDLPVLKDTKYDQVSGTMESMGDNELLYHFGIRVYRELDPIIFAACFVLLKSFDGMFERLPKVVSIKIEHQIKEITGIRELSYGCKPLTSQIFENEVKVERRGAQAKVVSPGVGPDLAKIWENICTKLSELFVEVLMESPKHIKKAFLSQPCIINGGQTCITGTRETSFLINIVKKSEYNKQLEDDYKSKNEQNSKMVEDILQIPVILVDKKDDVHKSIEKLINEGKQPNVIFPWSDMTKNLNGAILEDVKSHVHELNRIGIYQEITFDNLGEVVAQIAPSPDQIKNIKKILNGYPLEYEMVALQPTKIFPLITQSMSGGSNSATAYSDPKPDYVDVEITPEESLFMFLKNVSNKHLVETDKTGIGETCIIANPPDTKPWLQGAIVINIDGEGAVGMTEGVNNNAPKSIRLQIKLFDKKQYYIESHRYNYKLVKHVFDKLIWMTTANLDWFNEMKLSSIFHLESDVLRSRNENDGDSHEDIKIRRLMALGATKKNCSSLISMKKLTKLNYAIAFTSVWLNINNKKGGRLLTSSENKVIKNILNNDDDDNSKIIFRNKKKAIEAINDGDKDKLKRALRVLGTKGLSIEVPLNKEGGTNALHYAARLGKTDVIDFLINDLNFDVNQQDNNGSSALHFLAAQRGTVGKIIARAIATAKELLDHSADINIKDNQGMTPLHWAAKNGYAVMTEFLVQNGADLTLVDKDRNTARMTARLEGHEKPINEAIERGASAKQNFQEKVRTAIEGDGISSLVELFKTLSKDKDRHINIEGMRSLHYAASLNKVGVINYLIDTEKFDVNRPDDTDYKLHPLHYAAYNGNLSSVKLLIGKKANINAKSTKNMTPLHFAVHGGANAARTGNQTAGYVDIIKYLVGMGADVSIADWGGKTARDLAIDNGEPMKGAFDGLAQPSPTPPLQPKGTQPAADVQIIPPDLPVAAPADDSADPAPAPPSPAAPPPADAPVGPDGKPLAGIKLKMWQKKQVKPADPPSGPAATLPPPAPAPAPPSPGAPPPADAPLGPDGKPLAGMKYKLWQKSQVKPAGSPSGPAAPITSAAASPVPVAEVQLGPDGKPLTAKKLKLLAKRDAIKKKHLEKAQAPRPDVHASVPAAKSPPTIPEIQNIFLAIKEGKSLEILNQMGLKAGNPLVEQGHQWAQMMKPLHQACNQGNLGVIKYLIEDCSVKINEEDAKGMTPLDYTIQSGKTEAMEYMLDVAGAQVNTVDKAGKTPLHRAVLTGDPEFAYNLVLHGALVPPELSDEEKITEYLTSITQPQLFPLTKKYDEGIKSGDKDRKTLYRFLNISPPNDNELGHLPWLLHAIDNDNFEAIRFLVEIGKDVNIQNKEGMTALHKVVQKIENSSAGPLRDQWLTIPYHLMINGASYQEKNKNQKTPLDLARDKPAMQIFLDKERHTANQVGMAVKLVENFPGEAISELVEWLNNHAKAGPDDNPLQIQPIDESLSEDEKRESIIKLLTSSDVNVVKVKDSVNMFCGFAKKQCNEEGPSHPTCAITCESTPAKLEKSPSFTLSNIARSEQLAGVRRERRNRAKQLADQLTKLQGDSPGD